MTRVVLAGILMMAALVACTNQPTAKPEPTVTIHVVALAGGEPTEVVAAETVAQLRLAWQARQSVLVKMRPAFSHRVEFVGDADGGSWLYAGSGHAVRADKPYGTIYQLPNHELINQQLGIQQ